MKTPIFTLRSDEKKWILDFNRSQDANTFAKMDFHSRLLHSLAPDANSVWLQTTRMDAEIVGWPKDIVWERGSETSFFSIPPANYSLSEYTQILELAMMGLVGPEGGETNGNGKKLFRFAILQNGETREYRFYTKSRQIAALCVLYDLEAHPRNDLEINIPARMGEQKWPLADGASIVRTYGDPSKTADELRNEGWPRIGSHTAMDVFRKRVGGQIQQMYQLRKKDQTVVAQVMRSNIPQKWRDELYKKQDYTCQICLRKYDEELLEPDHRIPVIYEADELTEKNFLAKLMTLCRYCNQQKRETTKRLPADYDWRNSEWAFPEKFDLEIIRRRIALYRERTGKNLAELLDELGE